MSFFTYTRYFQSVSDNYRISINISNRCQFSRQFFQDNVFAIGLQIIKVLQLTFAENCRLQELAWFHCLAKEPKNEKSREKWLNFSKMLTFYVYFDEQLSFLILVCEKRYHYTVFLFLGDFWQFWCFLDDYLQIPKQRAISEHFRAIFSMSNYPQNLTHDSHLNNYQKVLRFLMPFFCNHKDRFLHSYFKF